MFQEKITNEDIVIQNGTSEGTRVKYRKGRYWYKEDSREKGVLLYQLKRYLMLGKGE